MPIVPRGPTLDAGDVGGGAADVDRDQSLETIMAGQRLRALCPAARAGAVGLDRHRPRHPGRAAVVAEHQQRPLTAGGAQLALGRIEKPLHRRVEEGVEQRGPSPPRIVGVAGDFVAVEDRHRAEQVRREGAQQGTLDRRLARRPVRPAERHDDAVGTARGQVGDGADDVHPLRLAAGRDGRDAVADERVEQVAGQCRRVERGVVDQPEPRPLALDDGVGALGRRIADVIGGQQQPLEIGLAEDLGAGLGQPLDQAVRQVERRRQNLGRPDLGAVDDADVGQRTAVVDVDQPAHNLQNL